MSFDEIKSDLIRKNNQLKRSMSVFNDESEPKVGIFWYLEGEDELFGVNSIEVSKGYKTSDGITIAKLHKNYWEKEYYRAKAKKKFDSIYMTNYVNIPRGRIFYKDGKFICYVGSWYKEIKDRLKELVMFEFDLPDVEFRVMEHWEIGHGWSEHDF